ncbi:MAG: alanine--tRNA ligase [Bacteroidota bacterium]
MGNTRDGLVSPRLLFAAPMRTSSQIRQDFLDFFRQKGHEIVPSAPLVPQDDPTLLFINAGMNPFKDVFLGTGSRPYTRVADTQKCLRVSGKHNDLEEVGLDTYHHTFFEMLGNWSFGDYFKREAITWAWELLTETWGLDPDRLYVTVHEGDKQLGLDADTEAAALWKDETGIDASHILYAQSKDNFWMMGDTGPCGPCSEIHYDGRSAAERAQVPGQDLVNQDHPSVIEIWNLVFIQYNAQTDGSLEPLAAQHVDTGMGFERICAVLQGKTSNYDTDLFAALLQAIADLAGADLSDGVAAYASADEKQQIAMRVIADHVRTVAFAIADGAQPSNTGRGYVIRRILRRAVRYGYQSLGLKEPFLHRLMGPLVAEMGDAFPELRAQQDYIERVTKAEEESFLRTLGTGIELFDAVVEELQRARASLDLVKYQITGDKALDIAQQASDLVGIERLSRFFGEAALAGKFHGEIAFLLSDTYGFPVDLTALMAREEGLTVDMERFEALLEEQRARGRADRTSIDQSQVDTWVPTAEAQTHDGTPIEFVGYDALTLEDARILKTRSVRPSSGEDENAAPRHEVVLNKTPFYAESGGQVGDTGTLTVGGEEIRVLDTQKDAEGTIIHIVDTMPSDVDAPVTAQVDAGTRGQTERHHTATHLLHAALREILGPHVQQKGSLVAPDRLRFDFSHYERVVPDELAQIERRINDLVQQNIPLEEERAVPIEEAKARGAMALFGEKYGDIVRVITFDADISVELCGGTHVDATGAIGLVKLTSEGSVASGVRRVEAVAGAAALGFLAAQAATLDAVRGQFKTLNRPVEEAVADLAQQTKDQAKEIAALKAQLAASGVDALIDDATDVDGVRLVRGAIDGADAKTLQDLAADLRERLGENAVVVLGAADHEAGKAMLVCAVTGDLPKRGVQAGKLVGLLAKRVGGGGGGRPTLATAGGRQPEHLGAALADAEALLRDALV